MERNEKKAYIAARAARELKDGDVVNLGIGLPTMVPDYLPAKVSLILQSENGMLGVEAVTDLTGPDSVYITDAGGNPSAVAAGGAFFDTVTSFSLIRGGHVDCTILGALEVDQEGNLANWIIPGKKVPGMGGAMDLVVGAKRVIVAMEHTAKGSHKIMKICRLPLTAVKCVDLIITEMAVFKVTEKGLILTEYNPEYTLEEIRQATEADYLVAKDLQAMGK